MGIELVGLKQPTTKAEIIASYMARFPARGKGSWKSELTHDLASITGMKPKNLEKRFDPQRRDNPEPRNADQYRRLGEDLPPMMPDSLHIEGTVYIKYSEECAEREVDEDVHDKEEIAAIIARYDAGDGYQAISNVYNELSQVEDEEGYDPCNEDGWDVTITAIYDEEE